MKKLFLILSLLVAANFCKGQLDTMLIRPAVTLQAQDWAWLRGKVGLTLDSAVMWSDRNVNTQMRAIQNLTWTTNVAIDSLPGKLVLAFYHVLRKEAGEVVSRYNAILTALQGVTQLSAYYTSYEAAITNDANQAINIGRYIYRDQ